jgi:hypothetical protein
MGNGSFISLIQKTGDGEDVIGILGFHGDLDLPEKRVRPISDSRCSGIPQGEMT